MTDQLLDTGAQAERTALAWQRTGFATIVVGALLIHAHSAAHPLPPWPGALLMAVGALTAAVIAPLRYVRVLHAVRAGRTPVSTLLPVGMTALVVVEVAGALGWLALS